MDPIDINADITRAHTLPSVCYTDDAVHRLMCDRVLARGWHLLTHDEPVRVPRSVLPITLLEGCLDEPLVLTRTDGDELVCLSNVCTHRGARVCEGAGRPTSLVCPYHGRRFDLSGKFKSMPEFDRAKDFPTEADDLPRVPLGSWKQFLFASLDPACELEELVADLEARCGFLPIADARYDPTRSRDYIVGSSWIAYCDNYLEGFHIPFVHQALGEVIDYGSYTTELLPRSVLQLGLSKGGGHVFDIPADHQDHGRDIAAYYWFLFPATMINLYPWGVSVNIVEPLGVDRTKVRFLSFVWDESKLDSGAGASLDRVEREDEHIVELVQQGLRSRFYDRGRYSPDRETGVHHFHRLIAEQLNAPG